MNDDENKLWELYVTIVSNSYSHPAYNYVPSREIAEDALSLAASALLTWKEQSNDYLQ